MDAPNDRFENDGDPLLEGLFAREHTHVPPEPFLGDILRAIAVERARTRVMTRLSLAAAVLVVILLSPRLIAGSVWLSSRLDDLFAYVSRWLATPYGMSGVVFVAVLVAWATRRARVW